MMRNKLIAITGGIGSGKSTALEIIASLGYKTFSCDDYTEKVYKDERAIKKLKKEFPTAVKDNLIDRKEISKIVFSDKKKYNALSEIVTSKIFSLVKEDAKKEKGIVFIEVPLLFEFGYEKKFDGVFVIVRQLDKRIDSVIKRSNLTEEEVKKRIASQFDYDSEKVKKYTVIEHFAEREELKEKLIKAISGIRV